MTPKNSTPDEHSGPFWAQDLEDGEHSNGAATCEVCGQHVAPDSVKYGKFGFFQPYKHVCPSCAKNPKFVSYEDSMSENAF